jgi:hypothetical protein
MRYKRINIEYWTDPYGTDFIGLNDLVKNMDQNYLLTINRKRTDASGGGLYDLLVKITEEISILDLAQSYVQDGVKVLIGYSLHSLLKELKLLFKNNQNLRPSLDILYLDYKDCQVIIYNLYESSIEHTIQNILKHLCQFQLNHQEDFGTIKKIHIPVINYKDYYGLCEFRVKLEVDEPITEFTKDYYFKFWGLTTKNGKFVYDIKKDKITNQVFFTQKSYNKLFDKAFKDGKIK